jgi:hypothetical protein
MLGEYAEWLPEVIEHCQVVGDVDAALADLIMRTIVVLLLITAGAAIAYKTLS